jgi:hypothetical protein
VPRRSQSHLGFFWLVFAVLWTATLFVKLIEFRWLDANTRIHVADLYRYALDEFNPFGRKQTGCGFAAAGFCLVHIAIVAMISSFAWEVYRRILTRRTPPHRCIAIPWFDAAHYAHIRFDAVDLDLDLGYEAWQEHVRQQAMLYVEEGYAIELVPIDAAEFHRWRQAAGCPNDAAARDAFALMTLHDPSTPFVANPDAERFKEAIFARRTDERFRL